VQLATDTAPSPERRYSDLNHDPLGEGSASVWADITARCPHLNVLGSALETRTFPERDLTVVGRSVADRLSAESPLAGLPVPRRRSEGYTSELQSRGRLVCR